MKYLLKFLVVSIIGFGLVFSQAALAADASGDVKIAATVNGSDITEKEVNASLDFYKQRAAMQGRSVTEDQVPEMEKQILDNLINAELLYQAAVRDKVKIDEKKYEAQWSRISERMESDPGFKKNMEKMDLTEDDIKNQIRRNMMIQDFVEQKFADAATVTPEEIKSYYESNKKMFDRPEQVRASHILVKVEKGADEKTKAEAKKKIEDILKQIKDGADFAALAQKYSDCPSKKKGGDLGYFGHGQMVKPFEDEAFRLKEGEVSGVVATQFGYHIIKVTGKKEKSTVSLEEATPRITSFLKQQQVQQEVRSFLEAEKAKAKITREY